MDFGPFEALIENAQLRGVFDCWRQHIVGGALPFWSDLEQSGHAGLTDYGWAWRLEPAENMLISVFMGPKPLEMYGASPVGTSLTQFYSPDIAGTVDQHLRTVLTGPMLLHASGPIYWRRRRADWGERIVMPMRFDARETADAVLGASVSDLTAIGVIAGDEPRQQKLTFIPLTVDEV